MLSTGGNAVVMRYLQLDYETTAQVGAESSAGVCRPGGIQVPKDDSERNNCNCRKHHMVKRHERGYGVVMAQVPCEESECTVTWVQQYMCWCCACLAMMMRTYRQ